MSTYHLTIFDSIWDPRVPELPDPSEMFPPEVPIEAIAKENKSPYADVVNRATIPPDFPWVGSLKNGSKPH